MRQADFSGHDMTTQWRKRSSSVFPNKCCPYATPAASSLLGIFGPSVWRMSRTPHRADVDFRNQCPRLVLDACHQCRRSGPHCHSRQDDRFSDEVALQPVIDCENIASASLYCGGKFENQTACYGGQSQGNQEQSKPRGKRTCRGLLRR
jgi:hypothetical protein